MFILSTVARFYLADLVLQITSHDLERINGKRPDNKQRDYKMHSFETCRICSMHAVSISSSLSACSVCVCVGANGISCYRNRLCTRRFYSRFDFTRFGQLSAFFFLLIVIFLSCFSSNNNKKYCKTQQKLKAKVRKNRNLQKRSTHTHTIRCVRWTYLHKRMCRY